MIKPKGEEVERVKNKELAKMINLCIAKMNVLEVEMEQTQNLLISMFVPREKQQKHLKDVQNNFAQMRDYFEDVVKKIQEEE